MCECIEVDEPTTTEAPKCPEMLCTIECSKGLKMGSDGCPMCECIEVDEPTTTEAPKCPEMLCTIECSKGLKMDSDGCPMCECIEVDEPTTTAPKCRRCCARLSAARA